MKIVLAHYSMEHTGGAEKYAQWLSKRLKQRGHEVPLLAHAFNKKSRIH
ncbi:MAG: hypothetical protein J7M18_04680 [Candidatus Eremiobacteraeota bacterium]|nr:hypothetical protein [Candidatus Eremiobacteraeota bacterium]